MKPWKPNNAKQSQTTVEQGWMVKVMHPPTTLNLIHFKMVEAMGLKIIASRSPWMASAAYQILWKSTNWFKSWWGIDTHRQHGDHISIHFSFRKERRLKIGYEDKARTRERKEARRKKKIENCLKINFWGNIFINILATKLPWYCTFLFGGRESAK
jgi:hypothetical protein